MTHYLLTIEQADGEVNIGGGVSEKYVDTKINELNNKIDTKTTMDEVKDVLSDQYTSKITFDSTLSGYTTTNDLKENILTNYAKTIITDNINNTLTSSTSISPGHKHTTSDITDIDDINNRIDTIESETIPNVTSQIETLENRITSEVYSSSRPLKTIFNEMPDCSIKMIRNYPGDLWTSIMFRLDESRTFTISLPKYSYTKVNEPTIRIYFNNGIDANNSAYYDQAFRTLLTDYNYNKYAAEKSHKHKLSDITDYTAPDLSTKADSVHTHTLSDITDLLQTTDFGTHTLTPFQIGSAFINYSYINDTSDKYLEIGIDTDYYIRLSKSSNETTINGNLIVNGTVIQSGSQTITHLTGTNNDNELIVGTFCETDGTIYDKFKDNIKPTDCICNIKQSTSMNKNIIGVTVSTDPIKFATHGDVLIKVVNDTYNVGDILVPGQGGYGKKPSSDELMSCLLNRIPTAKIISLDTGIDNEVACILL